MKQDRYNELEAWAERELKALPRRRAPEELMQRVRTAIATGQPVVTRQAAITWSRRTRFLALAACAMSLLAFCCWWAAGNGGFDGVLTNVRSAFAAISETAGGALAVLDALVLVLRKVGQPALLTALLLFAALSAFCAGVGSVCFRFVITEKEN